MRSVCPMKAASSSSLAPASTNRSAAVCRNSLTPRRQPMDSVTPNTTCDISGGVLRKTWSAPAMPFRLPRSKSSTKSAAHSRFTRRIIGNTRFDERCLIIEKVRWTAGMSSIPSLQIRMLRISSMAICLARNPNWYEQSRIAVRSRISSVIVEFRNTVL